MRKRILGIRKKTVFDLHRNDRIIYMKEGGIYEGTIKSVFDNCIVVRALNNLSRITLKDVLSEKVEIINIIKNT